MASYTSLSGFRKTGQGANDFAQDPKWVSASGHDYHLTADSPAIDSANAGVSGEQPVDIDGHPRVDDPATPNTYAAPPGTFDDRGAYELQLSSAPPSDSPPAAALAVTPGSGTAPLAVTADASASSDTDATPISSYGFDFGDGTTVGPQAGATASHTYPSAGTYTVTVTVTDSAGQASQATASVTVASAAGGTNLVKNPGFETDLSGWNTSGNTSVTLTRVTGGRSGAYAAKLTNIGSSASPTTTKTLSTAWQQVTVTDVPMAPGASTLDFNAYISSAPPGTCFYADDASITLG